MATILLIEDDPNEALVISIMLQQQVFPDGTPISCISVAHGAAALNWLAQQAAGSVATVVVDLSLSQGDHGLVLLPKLRRSAALSPAALVIVRSAFDDQATIEAVRRAGGDAFISKQRVRLPSGREIVDVAADIWAARAGGAAAWIVRA